jgi:hypothetical protein
MNEYPHRFHAVEIVITGSEIRQRAQEEREDWQWQHWFRGLGTQRIGHALERFVNAAVGAKTKRTRAEIDLLELMVRKQKDSLKTFKNAVDTAIFGRAIQ